MSKVWPVTTPDASSAANGGTPAMTFMVSPDTLKVTWTWLSATGWSMCICLRSSPSKSASAVPSSTMPPLRLTRSQARTFAATKLGQSRTSTCAGI